MLSSNSLSFDPIASESTLAFDMDASIKKRILDNLPNGFDADTSNFDNDAFKDSVPAGSCLEFYNGRLFFAINNFVYCTKAFDIEHVDYRFTVVTGFSEPVTMIARVNDGLYIATANSTYFLAGASPQHEDGGFTQRHISKYGAIKGTVARVQADFLEGDAAGSTIAVWGNKYGIFYGMDGGQIANLSKGKLALPAGSGGTSTVVESDGTFQHIMCYQTSIATPANTSKTGEARTYSEYETLVTNLINGEHSRYSNYYFNSFFQRNGNLYGVNSTGIYKMGGDTDNGTPITMEITTGSSTIGNESKKYIPDSYVSARSEESIEMDVFVNEQEGATELASIHPSEDKICSHRFKMPKGLSGESWQFKLRNTDGARCKIFSMEIPYNTSRR